jgi:poly(3-hydroxybutyrate) depolymerase
MNPNSHAQHHVDYFKDLVSGDDEGAKAHRKFYDEYNAVLDMDADFYLDTIKVVFQDYSLAKGTWEVRGVDGKLEHVRPQDITTTAVFSVEGELDDITGTGQTTAVHTLCSGIPESRHQHLEVKAAGHYGIFSGHRWHEQTYPALKSFIRNHNA